MSHRMVGIICCGALLVACGPQVQGQTTTTGLLTGAVTDPGGVGIANVKLTLLNSAGLERTGVKAG